MLCSVKSSFLEELVEAIKKARSKSSRAKIYVRMFTKNLYALWIQKNSKFYRNSVIAPNMLTNDILFKVACNCNDNERALLIMS